MGTSFILGLCVGLSSCGPLADKPGEILAEVYPLPPRQIDPELEGLLGRFLADGQRRGVMLYGMYQLRIFRYGILDQQTAGQCRRFYTNRNQLSYTEVVINKDWRDADPWVLAGIVYHELGHCVLKLDHSGIGMMRAVIHTAKQYQANWNDWVNQLFLGD